MATKLEKALKREVQIGEQPYMLTIDDVRQFPKYEKTWKEIFQIR